MLCVHALIIFPSLTVNRLRGVASGSDDSIFEEGEEQGTRVILHTYFYTLLRRFAIFLLSSNDYVSLHLLYFRPLLLYDLLLKRLVVLHTYHAPHFQHLYAGEYQNLRMRLALLTPCPLFQALYTSSSENLMTF